MVQALTQIFRVLGKMVVALFKRGKGLFKFLFVVDDFFRLFTMTFLFPVFFTWIGLGKIFISLGVILGLVIDIHDFITSPGNMENMKRRR
ncbi:hypothetical protein HN789_06670 [archaeon]|jgi:hypothetical protein|nr:hypothetical protein [archaeon]MBT3720950.1 hypothetical protein [archaeon]MBT4022752.1 hypothetical protein [archaeon]MBT4273054.1 hypothetical protein [archaeon]MBT4461035.1 hypothetical protein [archaeon]